MLGIYPCGSILHGTLHCSLSLNSLSLSQNVYEFHLFFYVLLCICFLSHFFSSSIFALVRSVAYIIAPRICRETRVSLSLYLRKLTLLLQKRYNTISQKLWIDSEFIVSRKFVDFFFFFFWLCTGDFYRLIFFFFLLLRICFLFQMENCKMPNGWIKLE